MIAFNEAPRIERALLSVLGQDTSSSFECIVVDDGSEDTTMQVVSRLAAADVRVRLIALEANGGRGHARRTGVAAARGSLIATVDADVVLPMNWLEQCKIAMAETDAIGVGGTVVPDGDVVFIARHFGLRPRTVPHTTLTTGSNSVFRREAFSEVTYDAGYRQGEDSAFNNALLARGHTLHTVDGLVAEHLEDKTLRQAVTWAFINGRAAGRQLRETKEVRTPDKAFGVLMFALCAAVLPGRRLRRSRRVFPLLMVSGVSLMHVHTKFELGAGELARFAGAVGTNTIIIGGYFAGRLVDLATSWPLES